MKLLLDEIKTKWLLINEYSLNKEYRKEVWVFYSLYAICLAVSGKEDKYYLQKNYLINKYLETLDKKYYHKLKRFMAVDVCVINKVLNILEEQKEGGVQKGDYKKPFMFAINIYE